VRARYLMGCGLAALLCATGVARAGTVTYGFNTEFSGGEAPGGTAPWITATFTDITSGAHAGSVELTISTANLVSSENISEIDFNILPALTGQLGTGKNPGTGNLVFTSANGAPGTTNASSISAEEDAYKADGDGLYDIQLLYPTGSGFNANMTSSYYITDASATISALSFYTLSTSSGGHGPFYSAAHVQNTTGAGSGGSGWVAPVPVPIPAGAVLMLSGLAGLGAAARRRRLLQVHGLP
jgi:hypothetical protein